MSFKDSFTYNVRCRYSVNRLKAPIAKNAHLHCTCRIRCTCLVVLHCVSAHGMKVYTAVHHSPVLSVNTYTADARWSARSTWTVYCAPGAPFSADKAHFTGTLQCAVRLQCVLWSRCTIPCTYRTLHVHLAVCEAHVVSIMHQLQHCVIL